MKKEYAFPSETEGGAPENPTSGEFYSLHTVKRPDMTLRDYFAGKILANSDLTGFLGSPVLCPKDVAKVAYEVADAMLKEREKGGK